MEIKILELVYTVTNTKKLNIWVELIRNSSIWDTTEKNISKMEYK